MYNKYTKISKNIEYLTDQEVLALADALDDDGAINVNTLYVYIKGVKTFIMNASVPREHTQPYLDNKWDFNGVFSI